MTGQEVVRVEKIVQIQLVPRSLAGRIFTVVLAVLAVGACSLIAPLEDVKDNGAATGGNGGRGAGGGSGSGATRGVDAACAGVFDESLFDDACFQ